MAVFRRSQPSVLLDCGGVARPDCDPRTRFVRSAEDQPADTELLLLRDHPGEPCGRARVVAELGLGQGQRPRDVMGRDRESELGRALESTFARAPRFREASEIDEHVDAAGDRPRPGRDRSPRLC
jgi:hypothetical protein